MNIDTEDAIFSVWRENYLQGTAAKRACIIQDFKQELELRKEYQGREILEMIQNADDQQSSTMLIQLSQSNNGIYSLAFSNSGPKTKPFTKAGFQSIMRPHLSSKQLESGGYGSSVPIGNKGLGFRSLLNWSKHIEIKSAGLHCIFSTEHAEKAWNEIKSDIEKNRTNEIAEENDWASLLRDIESEMNAKRCSCPISILATPERKKMEIIEASTSIIVYFEEKLLDSICTQLKEFRANSLLFVRNLEKITIKNQIDNKSVSYCISNKQLVELDDEARTIIGANGSISTCVINYSDHEEEWIKYAFKDGSKELAIAWLTNGQVCEKDRVVHCFFPTRVRLELPCVLHGSFEVDSSRNHIIASSTQERPNETLLEEAGRCLVRVAEYRAFCEAKKGKCSWGPYGLINLDAKKLDAPMNYIKKGIDSELTRNPKIFPTVSDSYRAKDEICCYGESLASFLMNNRERWIDTETVETLAGHLIPGFSKYGFCAKLDSFCETRVENLAKKLVSECNGEARGRYFYELIEALIEEKKRMSPYGNFQLSCLPDEDGIIQHDTVYVNSGIELENAKDLLGVHYIDSNLVKVYESKIQDRKTWDSGRWLAKHLNEIAQCSTSDITNMKERVCSITKKDDYRNIDFFKKIIKSLFETYRKNPIMDSMGENFNVLNCAGEIKPAYSVSLFDENKEFGLASQLDGKIIEDRWWLKLGLNDWCDYLETDRESAKTFLIDFLGVRLYIPIHHSICQQSELNIWLPYIQQEDKDGVPWNYVDQRLKEHYCTKFNKGIVIEDGFLEEIIGEAKSVKDLLPFLRLLYKDEFCRKELLNPSIEYHYFRNRLYRIDFKSSLLSFTLSHNDRLAVLQQYAVDEDCCAEGTQLSKDSILRNMTLDERRTFLCKLGASPRLSQMPVDNIYEMLASRMSPVGIQSFYKRIREALVRQRDALPDETSKKTFEEKCNAIAKQRLSKLYARNLATGLVELKDRETIRYWDNDVLSKAILSKQFKL